MKCAKYLEQWLALFSCEGPDHNYFRLCWPDSPLAATRPCQCGGKAAVDSTSTSESDFVPVTLELQKRAVGPFAHELEFAEPRVRTVASRQEGLLKCHPLLYTRRSLLAWGAHVCEVSSTQKLPSLWLTHLYSEFWSEELWKKSLLRLPPSVRALPSPEQHQGSSEAVPARGKQVTLYLIHSHSLAEERAGTLWQPELEWE